MDINRLSLLEDFARSVTSFIGTVISQMRSSRSLRSRTNISVSGFKYRSMVAVFLKIRLLMPGVTTMFFAVMLVFIRNNSSLVISPEPSGFFILCFCFIIYDGKWKNPATKNMFS